MARAPRPLYVASLQLVNIKCFAEANLQFDHDGETTWAVIVGDNATGKTVLLRSLALGLCDQTSAAGLMKESDEGYIRRPKRKGHIVVDLYDPDARETRYRITTTLTKVGTGERAFERLEQVTEPEVDFPWERIFACAYGMGRTISGTGDIGGYSVINAVYNLFSYGEGLQNPELILRRLEDEDSQQMWLDRLATVLASVTDSGIHLEPRGLTFDGRWGPKMPFRDLPDGVRGTFLWTADLIGWAIAYDNSTNNPATISGVVLIDELEQQLHATWQRTVVHQLQELFPRVQFIATTHSPLIASGVGPRVPTTNSDRLFVLGATEDHVEVSPHEFMRGWGMDQVLASRAFKYQIEAEPETERILRLASMLGDKKQRTDQEEQLFQDVKNTLKGAFLEGKSSVERLAEIEANDDLRRRVEEMIGRQKAR